MRRLPPHIPRTFAQQLVDVAIDAILILAVFVVAGLALLGVGPGRVVVDLRSHSNPARIGDALTASARAHRLAGALRLCSRYNFGPPLREPDYDWERKAWVVECFPRAYRVDAPFGEILSETLPQ